VPKTSTPVPDVSNQTISMRSDKRPVTLVVASSIGPENVTEVCPSAIPDSGRLEAI